MADGNLFALGLLAILAIGFLLRGYRRIWLTGAGLALAAVLIEGAWDVFGGTATNRKMLIGYVVVAPLVEEVARAVGARVAVRVEGDWSKSSWQWATLGIAFSLPEVALKLAELNARAANALDGPSLFFTLSSIALAVLMHVAVTLVLASRLIAGRSISTAWFGPVAIHGGYNTILITVSLIAAELDEVWLWITLVIVAVTLSTIAQFAWRSIARRSSLA